MARIAIIGAGVSGLAAAWALRTEPVEVTVFEKSRGHSGRAATRRRYGSRYDHGANYLSPSSDRVRDIITGPLNSDELVDIGKDVWRFDGDGAVQPDRDEETRWTYRSGISMLGKLFARKSTATVETETRIARLRHRDETETWTLTSEDNETFGPFDVVLLTPPAPQTSDILAESRFDDDLRSTLIDGIEEADYAPQFAYMFSYERTVKRPGDCYGLVNADGEHDLSWIGYEHDKPDRVPDGNSLIVIQTSPKWTASRVDADPDFFMSEVKEKAADVLGADLRRPAWYDVQRWRYSLPTNPAHGAKLKKAQDVGLFFSGDYVAGKGRLGTAIETGLDVAEEIKSNGA